MQIKYIKTNFAPIILLLVFFTCLSKNVRADTNVDSDRLDQLEKSVENIQKSLSNHNEKNIMRNLEDLIDEVKLLRSDLDRLEIRMKNYAGKYEAFENNINKKIDIVSSSITKDDSDSLSQKDSYTINNIAKAIENNGNDEVQLQVYNNKNDTKVSSAYQKAYIMLKKNNGTDQNKALESFEKFVHDYSNSPLCGNAYYWIGFIHFQQKQYSRAAIDFLNGYKVTPKSGRAIDNLLGLSDALIKLNKYGEACSTLNKLYDEFPNMNITNKRHADEMMSTAHCIVDQ